MRRSGRTVWGASAALLWVAALACGSGDTGGSASPTPTANVDTGTIVDEFLDRADKKNVVRLVNTENGRFMARSKIVIDKVSGPTVDALNEAAAESRCTDCQTIAVALQVVIYRTGAPSVTPQNVAVALNVNCTRCVTVALAYQYVIPVDDPKVVPDRVRELTKEMDRELKYFEKVKSVSEIDPVEAERRLVAVIDKFSELKQHLRALRDEKRGDASPSPSASATPAPTVAPTAAPTASPAPSASPTSSP